MSSIKIGIDLSFLHVDPHYRGIAQYIRTLVPLLSSNAPDLCFYYLSPPRANLDFLSKHEIQRIHTIPMLQKPKRFFYIGARYFGKPYCKKTGIQLVHFLEPSMFWRAKNIYTVVTVYDLILILFWQQYLSFRNFEYLLFLKYKMRQLKKIDHIICISNTTKNDLVNFIGINPQKITAIPLAGRPIFRSLPKHECMQIVKKYLLKECPYFIYVGGYDFRKNLPFLFRSFDLFRKQMSAKLILIGQKPTKIPIEVQKFLSSSQFKEDIVFTGYISDEHLVCLMNCASALISPSIYEGFGLPFIEAMNCKIPVIAYPSDAAKEILDDSPGLLSIPIEAEMAKCMQRVIEELSFKEEILKIQETKLSLYSWEKTTKATIEIYRKVLDGRE